MKKVIAINLVSELTRQETGVGSLALPSGLEKILDECIRNPETAIESPTLGKGGGPVRFIGEFCLKFKLSDGEFSANNFMQLLGERVPQTVKYFLSLELAQAILQKDKAAVNRLKFAKEQNAVKREEKYQELYDFIKPQEQAFEILVGRGVK